MDFTIINNDNDVRLNKYNKIIISVEKTVKKKTITALEGLMDFRILKSWGKNYFAMDLDQIIQMDLIFRANILMIFIIIY